jgi:hypothetical protein
VDSSLPDTINELQTHLVPNSWPQLDPYTAAAAPQFARTRANSALDSSLHDEVVVDLDESTTAGRSFWKPLIAVTGIATLLGASYAVARFNNNSPAVPGPPRVVLEVSPTATPTTALAATEPTVRPTLAAKPAPTTGPANRAALANSTSSPPGQPSFGTTSKPARAMLNAKPPMKATAAKPVKGKPAPTPLARKAAPAPVTKKAAPAPTPTLGKAEKKKKKEGGSGGGKQKTPGSPLPSKEKEKKKKKA